MLVRLVLDVLAQVHGAAPRAHLGDLLWLALALAPTGTLLAWLLGRRPWSAVLGGMAGSALSVALTLTVFRGGSGLHLTGAGRLSRVPISPSGLHACVVSDPWLLSGDRVANLALYAPVALLMVLAIGRPAAVTLALAAIAVAVELVQAATGVGVCDSSDVLLNVLGVLVAAVVASGVLTTALSSVPGSPPCRRSS